MLRAVLCAIALSAFSAAAASQNQPDVPKLTSRVELVSVPVVVTRGGTHVSGLSATHFAVSEDGVQQKLAFFQEISITRPLVRHDQADTGVFTNRLAGTPSERRVTVVLFDMLNTPVLYQHNARAEFIKFLESAAVPGEPIMILTLTAGGVKVLHDFATDPSVLVAALRRSQSSHTARGHDDLRDQARSQDESSVTNGQSKNGAQQNVAAPVTNGQSKGDAEPRFSSVFESDVTNEGVVLDEFLSPKEGSLESMIAMRTGENIRTTLDAFQQIARAVGAVPGRKTLIWITAGIPFDWVGDRAQYASLYQETWNLLSAANFAVYPVNVKLDNSEATQFTAQTMGGKPTPQLMRERMAKEMVQQSFAAYTGGTVCTFRNDLDTCFKKAVADSMSYYLLAYYAKPRATAGWRKLHVKVDEPGAKVRARSGYFSLGPAATQDVQRDFALAFTSPFDYTSIPMTFRWTGTSERANDSGKTKHSFLLVVPPQGVTLDSASHHLQMNVVVLVRDSNGKQVSSVDQVISGDLSPEHVKQLTEAGLRYLNAILLAPGEYSVRIAVRDALTGNIGTLTVPLTSN